MTSLSLELRGVTQKGGEDPIQTLQQSLTEATTPTRSRAVHTVLSLYHLALARAISMFLLSFRSSLGLEFECTHKSTTSDI